MAGKIKARVLRGGWFCEGREAPTQPGDIIESSPEQVVAWASEGYVEAVKEPRKKDTAAVGGGETPETKAKPKGRRAKT